MGEYIKFRVAELLSTKLPLAFSYWVGMRFADYFYWRDKAKRQRVTTNLRRIAEARGLACTPAALESMARKMFQYFAKYLVDFFRYSRLSYDRVKDRICIERQDILDAVCREGKGAILMTAHLGNWELGGLAVAALGYPLSAVFRPMGSERVDRMFRERRQGRGIRPIPLGGAARGLFQALRQGEMVALLADRDFSNHHEHFPFFGQPARLPSGPARLAMRTGAPIVPGFMLRQVDDRFLLRLYPPLYPRDYDSVEALQARIVEQLEQAIGENAHQWFIFDDFWKDDGVAMEETA